MAWLSFVILALAFVYTSVGGARDWLRFKITDDAKARRYYYKKWVIDTWLALGLAALVATWTLGKLDLLLAPLPHAGLQFNLTVPRESGSAAGLYVGIGVGLAAAVAVLALRLRQSAKKAATAVNATNPLIPRNRGEQFLAVQLSLAAGVAEEFFFRAAVPVLAFTATNNATFSIVASVLFFGLYHYYQGVKGVVATAFIGFILMRLFISSGTILAPIGLHVFIDLWALLILPAIIKARPSVSGEGRLSRR